MPRRYSLGKREAAVGHTKSAIVTALLRLMRRRAYDGITIKQIAAEADVAEKTVQRHFGSKDAIFVAFAEDAVGRAQQGLVQSANGRSVGLAVQQLVTAVYSLYEVCKDRVAAFVTIAESGSQDVAKARQGVRTFGGSLVSSLVDTWPEAWQYDSERTRQVLTGLLSFAGWRLLREECGLSAEEAVFAVTEGVGRTLMKRVVRGEGADGGAST